MAAEKYDSLPQRERLKLVFILEGKVLELVRSSVDQQPNKGLGEPNMYGRVYDKWLCKYWTRAWSKC